MFTALLTDAFSENDPGIDIGYRKDGGGFNLQRLRAKTKVHIESLRDFLFADNFALNASTEADIQISLNIFRMWQLWFDNKYQTNLSHVPTGTKQLLH